MGSVLTLSNVYIVEPICILNKLIQRCLAKLFLPDTRLHANQSPSPWNTHRGRGFLVKLVHLYHMHSVWDIYCRRPTKLKCVKNNLYEQSMLISGKIVNVSPRSSNWSMSIVHYSLDKRTLQCPKLLTCTVLTMGRIARFLAIFVTRNVVFLRSILGHVDLLSEVSAVFMYAVKLFYVWCCCRCFCFEAYIFLNAFRC